jgi:hypothetical protein
MNKRIPVAKLGCGDEQHGVKALALFKLGGTKVIGN